MGPLRRRRFPATRKVDHSSYVQSLFQEFLRRNQQTATKLAPIPEKPPSPEVNHRPNPYRESIDRILRQERSKPQQQDQQGIVKQFFQSKPSNNVDAIADDVRRKGPVEPVFARFKRREGTDQFVKCDPSPGVAPAGGLIRWLQDRKRERLEREQRQRTKRLDEYLNLPGDFFSGQPALSINTVADKTLASIASAFVPPVASTPLDRPFPVAICSPIISDPDEIHAKKVVAVPKPKIVVKKEDLEFVEKFKLALDSFSRILVVADGMVSPLDRNYGELQRPRRNGKADETSMVINVQLGCDRTHSSPAMNVTKDSFFVREVLRLVTPEVKGKKRFQQDPLLTYSPPCPKLDRDLELTPIHDNTIPETPSVSNMTSTFMSEFINSPLPNDAHKTNPDPLFFSPTQKYSKSTQLPPPEPDFSFLQPPRKIQQQQSDFSFEYSQEDFRGPIFPTQADAPDLGATTLDFDEDEPRRGLNHSSLDFTFSQASDWERF